MSDGTFTIGDSVVKNPATWQSSEFDAWGAGEGVGIVVAPPIPLDSDTVDVRWPAGRCFHKRDELLRWESTLAGECVRAS